MTLLGGRALNRSFLAIAQCVAVLASFACSGVFLNGSERLDYSGTYKAQQKSNKRNDVPAATLHVTQSDQAIEVTKNENGSRITNRFPLDGSEGPYTSPSGKSGKGKGQLKSKELILEYVVVTRLRADAPLVRVGMKERWRLSADRKILTIRFYAKFPDADPSVCGALEGSFERTEKYVRTENP